MAIGLNLPEHFKLSAPRTWFRAAVAVDSSTLLSRRHIYILPHSFWLVIWPFLSWLAYRLY